MNRVSTSWTVPAGSVRVCGPCGGGRGCVKVPLRVHSTLVFFFGFIVFSAFVGGKGADAIFASLIYGTVGIFSTVLVHEMGHTSASLFLDCQPSHILLWPLGGIAVIANFPSKHLHRVLIALAGPITHVPMLLVWYGLFNTVCELGDIEAQQAQDEACKAQLLQCMVGGDLTSLAHCTEVAAGCTPPKCVLDPVRLTILLRANSGTPTFFVRLFFSMLELNFIMFIFNGLLPVVPLDASTILVSSLLSCNVSMKRVALVALVVSAMGLLGLVIQWLAFGFISGWANLSPMTLFVTLWLGWHTYGLYKAYKGDKLNEHKLFATAPAAEAPTPSLTTHPVQHLAAPLSAAGGGSGGGGCGCGGSANPFFNQQSSAKQPNPFFASPTDGGASHVAMVLLALTPLMNTWTVELVH